jgi:hypothetical protein
MRNILFLLFLLLSFSFKAYSNELNCNSAEVDDFLVLERAKFITITTNNSRKWTKNYFKALKTQGLGHIAKKRKRKFNAEIKVLFNNELECTFPAKIRINGDNKDHLNAEPPIASLDVKLLDGNINSTTKFKLFIPHTRNGDNEIFATTLLRELEFLAPKTYYIDAIFNGKKTKFLFQEKIVKEFIESNNLREAPILEGDERFFNDTELHRLIFARVVNKNWINKGTTSLDISKLALEKLNRAYLKNLSGQYITKNRTSKFMKPNVILSEANIEKEMEFGAILTSIGALHSFVPANRKFYYDPMYRYFRFIYYDGNSSIVNLTNTSKDWIDFGELNNNEIIGSNYAIKSLNNLDRKKLKNTLQKFGLNYSQNRVDEILSSVLLNLEIISKGQKKDISEIIYKPYFSSYNNFYEKGDINKVLIFSTKINSMVEVCNFSLEKCNNVKLDIKSYAKLLSGKYTDYNNKAYIYIGDKEKYILNSSIEEHDERNLLHLSGGVQLLTYGNSKISINKQLKKIIINQSDASDKVLLFGGQLRDWSIIFNGSLEGENLNRQRFDQNLLTGCLTLLDMSVKNINITVNRALCEDGVNLVRVSGDVNDVIINNVMSDAIDVDFSELNFNTIKISDAKNDCIDLSSGNYYINHANLSNCSDKAISVGEKSVLSVNLVRVSKASIGIAAKDSSVVNTSTVVVNKVPICFAAYNKKQEFWGGKISVKTHNCNLNQVIEQKGSLVEFIE